MEQYSLRDASSWPFPFFYDEGWKLWIFHESRERMNSIALVFRVKFNSNLLHYKDFLILLARNPFNLMSLLLTEENLNASSSLALSMLFRYVFNELFSPSQHSTLDFRLYSRPIVLRSQYERGKPVVESNFSLLFVDVEKVARRRMLEPGASFNCARSKRALFPRERELCILPLTMPWVQWNLHLRVEQQE